jgi:hypothetical protein
MSHECHLQHFVNNVEKLHGGAPRAICFSLEFARIEHAVAQVQEGVRYGAQLQQAWTLLHAPAEADDDMAASGTPRQASGDLRPR